jgi:hypothetical protein
MLALEIGSLCLLLTGASPDARSLAEVWQKEVLQGDVQSAAESYEKLYLSAPSQELGPEVRRKAALRAGICFEKMGNKDNAKLAYESLLKMSSSTDALASEAKLHLLRLSAPLPAATPPFSEISVEVAIQKLVEALAGVEKEREETLRTLERSLVLRKERMLEARELFDRLLWNGASLYFIEEEPGASGTEWIASLKDIFRREGDWGKVQVALAERYADRALAALSARSWLEGARDLERARALAPGGSLGAGAPADWCRLLLEKRFDADQLAFKARRRLLDKDLSQRSALRREGYDLLKSAELATSDRKRADLAVQSLDQLRDLLDWTRPNLREDPEIRSLALRASRLLLYLGGKSGQEYILLDLWNKARDSVAMLLSLSEAHAEIASEEARFRAPVSGRGSIETATACRTEIERLLSIGREALLREDTARLQRSLRDARVLLGWVPEIDPASEYQRQFDSLQQKPPPGGKKPAPDAKAENK